MNLIETFETIRDIPFRIPLNKSEEDNCCNGKVIRFKKILDKNRYESRYRVCEFYWSEVNLPKELLSIPHADLSTHVYLEIKIDGNWVNVDPTWDKGLKTILPVNEWDGKSNTAIAVKPTKIYDTEKSAEIMKDESNENLEKELKDSGEFFKALNEWLEVKRLKE